MIRTPKVDNTIDLKERLPDDNLASEKLQRRVKAIFQCCRNPTGRS